MSHYRNIQTQITDVKALVRALCRVQLRGTGKSTLLNQIEIHEKAVNLMGYIGDRRNDLANVVIRRKYVGSSSNDLGFIREANGQFRAIISDFDSGYYGEKWLKKLYTYYAVECAKMQYEQRNIQYQEFVDPNDPQKRPRLLAEVN